jgi:ribosomal protein S18 acetylase RimI-like enzyme
LLSSRAVRVLNHRDRQVAAGICRVQREAYQVEARLIGFSGIPPLHDTVEDVMALDLMVLGIVEGGEPIAILGYQRDGDRVEIDRLAVRPDHFRRGLARGLIEALHEREGDAALFHVSTGRENQPALTLYRQMGYQPVEDVELPEGVVITRLVREQAG